MKSKAQLTGLAALLLACFTSCLVTKMEKVVYTNVKKAPEVATVAYQMPTVSPTNGTTQLQKKGDITVSSEIVAFKAVEHKRVEEQVVATANTELDMYEKKTTSFFLINPDRILFNIRVRNQSSRILKLAEVAFVLSVDGVQVSLEDEQLEQWFSGLVIPGNEKEYSIKGSLLSSLPDKCVIGMFLYDMPVAYDAAGNISKKENFEWYFMYSRQKEEKQITVRYDYEERPVYKEICAACKGAGSFSGTVTCTVCSGKGKYTNKENKVVTCYSCSGSGKKTQTKDCASCVAGKIAHRKSHNPSIDEKWTGYRITVVTTPSRAQVSVMDPATGVYKQVGSSGGVVEWWAYSSKGQGKVYPIKLHYDGKEWMVKPENEKGAIIPKLQVDFSSGAPKVIKGKLVSG